MNIHQKTLLDIQTELAAMPEIERGRIEALAAIFREAVQTGGRYGYMAMALVGAELAADMAGGT